MQAATLPIIQQRRFICAIGTNHGIRPLEVVGRVFVVRPGDDRGRGGDVPPQR